MTACPCDDADNSEGLLTVAFLAATRPETSQSIHDKITAERREIARRILLYVPSADATLLGGTVAEAELAMTE